MNYTVKTFPEEQLIIQRYVGNVRSEDILKNDDVLYGQYCKKDKYLYMYADIEKATFPDISFGSISELFGSIDKYIDNVRGMKIALFNGENSEEDFLKSSSYSKHDTSRNIEIKSFVSSSHAYQWLQLSKKAVSIIEEIYDQDNVPTAKKPLANISRDSHVGTYMVKGSKLVYCNSDFLKMWGYSSAKEIINKEIPAFVVPSSVPKVREEIEKRIETNSTSHYTAVAIKKDGSTFDIEIFGNSIMHGQERLAAGMVIDISKQVQKTNILESQVKILASDLHELQHRTKNSFGLITGLLYISETSADTKSKEAKQILNDLRIKVTGISELYNLLCLSKDIKEVEMENYLRKIITAAASASPNISCEYELLAMNLPVQTASTLGIVVAETVTNAIKHAFPRQAKGTITASSDLLDDKLVIKIADNGIGMTKPVNDETSLHLGITIINKFVKQLKGEVSFESSQGTVVTIVIPV